MSLDAVATIKTTLVIGAMLGAALFLQSTTYKRLSQRDPVEQRAAEKKAMYDLIHKNDPTPGTAKSPKIYNTPYQAEIRQRAGLPADATGLEDAINDTATKHIMESNADPAADERAQRMEQALIALQELDKERYQVMVWPQENVDQLCKKHPDGDYGCKMYRRDFAADKPAREQKEQAFLKQEQAVVDNLKSAYAAFIQ